jgi:hypothetical protein
MFITVRMCEYIQHIPQKAICVRIFTGVFMPTDPAIYAQGFAITAVLLMLEHVALFTRLRTRGDAGDDGRVLIKFVAGVLAILAGCASIAWQADEPLAVLAPVAASMGGLVILGGYAGRWLFGRVRETAYRRGRLHGLADKADIVAEERDGR